MQALIADLIFASVVDLTWWLLGGNTRVVDLKKASYAQANAADLKALSVAD